MKHVVYLKQIFEVEFYMKALLLVLLLKTLVFFKGLAAQDFILTFKHDFIVIF